MDVENVAKFVAVNSLSMLIETFKGEYIVRNMAFV